MKKSLLCMLVLLFSMGVSLSASAEVIEVNLQIPPPTLTIDDQGFTHVTVDGFYNFGAAPGKPSLPSQTLYLLIPPGQNVESVEVRSGELEELSGSYVVFPKQRPIPFSYEGVREFTEPDPAIYSSDQYFPTELMTRSPLQSMRGFVIQPVVITPWVYWPSSGRLGYYPSLEVSVRTTTGPLPLISPARFRGLTEDFDRVAALVNNPQMLSSYSSLKKMRLADSARYVIITSQALAGCMGQYTLSTLAAEKEARGLSTVIKTMEDIKASYTGRDDAEKVRSYILEAYNQGAEYVLLAGDADRKEVGGETQGIIVPMRDLWGDSEINYYCAVEKIPSDLYFACLDGDFNSNGNTTYGEPADDPDLFAEVSVGRAPVDSCTEISNFVRKTLHYQESSSEWLKNVWFVGEVLFEEYNYYAKDDLEKIHYSSSANGYTTKGFSENSFFNVNTLYDTKSYEFGPSDVLEIINGNKPQGPTHILNHLGHSYTDYNMRLYTDDIVSGMSNTEYFLDYSQGCYPGAIDNRYAYEPYSCQAPQTASQDSFVEHLLLDQYGAFAALMNTRFGLGGDNNGGDDYSNAFNRYFWDALFSQNISRLGAMQNFSREKVAGRISDSGIRWVYYCINLFGDPELSIHTSLTPRITTEPRVIEFRSVNGSTETLTVDLTIGCSTPKVLNFVASSSDEWITLSEDGGTTDKTIVVTINPAGKILGSYQGSIIIAAEGVDNSPFQVPVTLEVIPPPPVFGLTPQVLSFVAIQGSKLPGPQTLEIHNVGEGALTWSATPSGGWFTLSQSSGTAPSTIQITPKATNLSLGEHAGSILFSAPDTEDAQVTLGYNIQPPPVLAVDPLTISQESEIGQEPVEIGMQVFNQKEGATMDWAIVENIPWLSVRPQTGSAEFNQPSAITLTLDSTGLEKGLHEADLTISAPQAKNPKVVVHVAWTLVERPVLSVNPEKLEFSAAIGGETPAAQTVTIDNSGTGTLNWSVACEPKWLSCAPSSGNNLGTVNVGVNPEGLELGTYTGTMVVSSEEANNGSATVEVTLIVSPPANRPPEAPKLISPISEAVVGNPAPELVVQNAKDPDGDSVSYTLEIYEGDSEDPAVVMSNLPEGDEYTKIQVNKVLKDGILYRWHVRATDDKLSSGEWSETWQFTVKVEDEGGGCGCTSSANPTGNEMLGLGLVLALGALLRSRNRSRD